MTSKEKKMPSKIDANALKSEIRQAIINQKVNACPIAVRLAWHCSGTYKKKDNTGGSNGARMRFEPEKSDDANAGLGIVRDLLEPVKRRHPEISYADLYVFGGAVAIEFLGGPSIDVNFGRSDATEASLCPVMNGRLPDGALGAPHLREVFYRMGFEDRDIVALSGAHTLGRCHASRSGWDGPWTNAPLKFDNGYFRVLMGLDWVPRQWSGNAQFEDKQTKRLMMLPSDMALKTDSKFRVWAQKYADDEALFFRDFKRAFEKLLALGCPSQCQPDFAVLKKRTREDEFLEYAMHGSVKRAKEIAAGGKINLHHVERTSGRTALHKCAFWGHVDFTRYLVSAECSLNPNARDFQGDTPLHDAARFGHLAVVEILVASGADVSLKNRDGKTPAQLARGNGHNITARLLGGKVRARL